MRLARIEIIRSDVHHTATDRLGRVDGQSQVLMPAVHREVGLVDCALINCSWGRFVDQFTGERLRCKIKHLCFNLVHDSDL